MRRLENVCHWLTVMAPAQVIEPENLPPEIVPGNADAAAPVARPQPVASTRPLADAPRIAIGSAGWESGLEAEAMELLAAGRHDVWEALTKRFVSRLILTALANPRGRRIEAAHKLGIGRNTITRKIHELGLE